MVSRFDNGSNSLFVRVVPKNLLQYNCSNRCFEEYRKMSSAELLQWNILKRHMDSDGFFPISSVSHGGRAGVRGRAGGRGWGQGGEPKAWRCL